MRSKPGNSMLKTWWKIIRSAVWLIGGFLSFFAFIEILRAYQTLNSFHPFAGYLFLFVLSVVTICVFWYFIAAFAGRPAVLIPPDIGDPEKASLFQLRRYAKYLIRYIRRLMTNQALSPQERQLAADGAQTLAKSIDTLHRQQLYTAVVEAEARTIEPLLDKIDSRAKRQIRNSMRDVMVGVTLSPYKAADLLIVLYRNLTMVSRIIHVYNARPRLRQQLRIFADIVSVIATVNYINMGRNLIEGLGSHVPGIGRFIDDIAQGVGAGFMTTVVGHAAMDRCRAFRPFNERTAKDSLKKRAATFYTDVKDMFWADIWPSIKTRAGAGAAEVRDKIASALDETGNIVGSFIKVPVSAAVSAGNSVVSAGGKVTRFSIKGLKKATRIFHRRKRAPDQ